MNLFYFSGTKLPSQNSKSVHVMKMAQAFKKEGHNVTLFTKGNVNATPEDLFQIYNIDTTFEIKIINEGTLPILSNARLISAANIEYQNNTPDIIYGHDAIALALHAKKANSIIYEAHKLPLRPTDRIALSSLLKQDNLKGIIAISDILKQELLKQYPELDPEDIFVAHDGADLIDHIKDKANKLNALKGRKGGFNIGYAGSLHPGKGMALISRIAKIRPEYDFHILGGTLKQVQHLQTKNKYKNIHFYGFRDHSEIPSYLKSFDICIAPYQHRALIKTGRNTSRWISPMKIFEYMAAQKPIICSDLPVIHEILQHKYHAILPPASNEYKWAVAMDYIKENPDIGQYLAKNAYNSLKEKYTWDKRAAAILDFSINNKYSMHFADAS